jgi:hypothetical protein
MSTSVEALYKQAQHLTSEERRELARKLATPVTRGKTPGKVERLFGSYSSGDPCSADNDRIDADLAHEYGSDHETDN